MWLINEFVAMSQRLGWNPDDVFFVAFFGGLLLISLFNNLFAFVVLGFCRLIRKLYRLCRKLWRKCYF